MSATQSDCTKAPAILVVEDHDVLRFSIVTWLEHRFPGCTVCGVDSGEAALEQARATPLDIVLMDINLPGIDGLETASRIRAQAPETTVVVLTMHDTPHHRVAAAKAGATGYIAKRDMEAQLEPTIERLLRRRERTGS